MNLYYIIPILPVVIIAFAWSLARFVSYGHWHQAHRCIRCKFTSSRVQLGVCEGCGEFTTRHVVVRRASLFGWEEKPPAPTAAEAKRNRKAQP
jgi:hypothetical protein